MDGLVWLRLVLVLLICGICIAAWMPPRAWFVNPTLCRARDAE
jgi:hypothetical protein